MRVSSSSIRPSSSACSSQMPPDHGDHPPALLEAHRRHAHLRRRRGRDRLVHGREDAVARRPAGVFAAGAAAGGRAPSPARRDLAGASRCVKSREITSSAISATICFRSSITASRASSLRSRRVSTMPTMTASTGVSFVVGGEPGRAALREHHELTQPGADAVDRDDGAAGRHERAAPGRPSGCRSSSLLPWNASGASASRRRCRRPWRETCPPPVHSRLLLGQDRLDLGVRARNHVHADHLADRLARPPRRRRPRPSPPPRRPSGTRSTGRCRPSSSRCEADVGRLERGVGAPGRGPTSPFVSIIPIAICAIVSLLAPPR